MTGQADSVATVRVAASDLVYSEATQRIYVSVEGGTDETGKPLPGNIVIINPATATIEKSVPIGLIPHKLSLSGDGKTLFVGLDGEGAVRRFDTISQTPGAQFSLGQDFLGTRYYAFDLAVKPDDDRVVAVVSAQRNSSGFEPVATYVDGVKRGDTRLISASSITWGVDGHFYALSPYSDSTFYRAQFTNDGLVVTDAKRTGLRVSYNGELVFGGGELYASDRVINPETGYLQGMFPVSGYGVCPVPEFKRVCFLGTNKLLVYHRPTFRLVGSLDTPETTAGTPVVRWGSDGFAWILGGTFGTSGICVARTSLLRAPLPKTEPIPVNPEINGLRRVDLPANYVVYDEVRQELITAVGVLPNPYEDMSILSSGYNNSLTPVNPRSGEAGVPVYIGSRPQKLVMADDGKTVWTALFGAGSLRRYDAETKQAGQIFSLHMPGTENQAYPEDFDVQPGNPDTVAVALRNVYYSPRHEGVAIYDNGIQRPLATPRHTGSNVINWSANPETLYGVNIESSENGFRRMRATPQGVSVEKVLEPKGYNGSEFVLLNGKAYFNRGTVLDIESEQYLPSYQVGGDQVCIDQNLNRTYFVSGAAGGILRVYNLTTRALIGNLLLPDVQGQVKSVVRWGSDGLAFTNENYYGNKLWIFHSPLVNEDPKLSITINPAEVRETAGTNAATATLTRNINLQQELVVQVVTNRSTDVIVPSTVTIPAGQGSVTFPVGVKNNNVADGSRLALIVGRAPNYAPGTGRLTIYDDEARLTLSLSRNGILESDGPQASIATVSRNTPTNVALRVLLSSNDRSEIIMPAAVIIPAGASSVTFPVDAINDSDYDGAQSVILTAYTTGYAPARQTMMVYDDDVPSLGLTLTKTTISEGDGPHATLLIVTRNAYFADSVTVNLQSSFADSVKLPPTITIAAGERRALLWVPAAEDSTVNGERTCVISAGASRFVSAQTAVLIKDND